MLALSVVDPTGSRIRTGKKTIEVRDWQPDTLPIKNLLIVQNTVRLNSMDQPEDHDGKIVAMVDVTNIRPWVEDDVEASCANYFEDGWLAWELSNIRKIDYPKPVTARLRLYEVEINEELLS